MKKIIDANPPVTGVIALRGAVVSDCCTCELTDALDAAYRFGIVGRTHAIGLAPRRNGRKTLGVAIGGTIHAYVYVTECDVVTGAEVIDGAYGSGDGAMLNVLLSFVGRQFVYQEHERADSESRGHDSYGCCC